MKIIIDAFGGDNAPLSNIEGAYLASKEYDAEIMLCGNKEKIEQCAKENNIPLNNIKIVHADDIFDIHDDPNLLLKSKKNTSLAVAFTEVKDGKADAIVSAGSSGAVLMGGTFIVKRIKGLKRPAFAAVIPTTSGKPYMLLDSGANIDCRADALEQFGLVGSVYMKNVMGIEKPRVGLLNIGAEETKGGEELVEAYQKLKNSNLNFVGNIEPRDVPAGACDVLVCDGFSGNIVLKLTEGIAVSFMKMFKDILLKNFVTKVSALLIKSGLKDLKKKFDYKELGGAPLIGVRKPVIKAHGSSDSRAIKSAIRQAISFAETGVTAQIENAIKGVED